MNAKGRAALACIVFCFALSAGTARHIIGLQPGFEDFETRWPQDKAFQSNCPFASCSTVKAVSRRGFPVVAKDMTPKTQTLGEYIAMVTGPTKDRLIIPSYTCPPRRGEPGSCLSDTATAGQE